MGDYFSQSSGLAFLQIHMRSTMPKAAAKAILRHLDLRARTRSARHCFRANIPLCTLELGL